MLVLTKTLTNSSFKCLNFLNFNIFFIPINFLLKNVIEGLALHLVLDVPIGVGFTTTDGPAVFGAIALDPPTVQNGAV